MSKTVSFRPVDVPLHDAWDVIVAGGGPAGCTAAIAASRTGAKVLLIERTGALGGMGTMGLIPAWCPFSDGIRIVYQGLAEKVLRETLAGMPHLKPTDVNWTPIDPERLKQVYDTLVVNSGAKVRFDTMICGVDKDESGNIKVIYAASKRGVEAFGAKVFIDCTGDADLAAWGGAPCEKGGVHGELQPATHCFVLANIDVYAYQNPVDRAHGNVYANIYKIAQDGQYSLIRDGHGCNSLIGPSSVGFNAGHIWDIDNTDPDSVSAGLLEGRKMAAQFRDALAEYNPKAFANAWLAQTAPLLGIRETRRIIGDYVLTREDFIARASFADEICRNNYYIDVHQQKENSVKAINPEDYHYREGESHGIPYRCLLPRTLRNVLVAGRCISTDRPVQGSTRVMPVCLAMGEAAGTAAAMAASRSGDVRVDVDTNVLRTTLRDNGAYLP